MSDSLRSEIYVLTALLQDEQRRSPERIIPSIKELQDRVVLNPRQTTTGKTFQHFATILTRGSQDERDRIVAVTGGPLNENPLRIYLTTRSPSIAPTVSPSLSNEINDTDNEPVYPEDLGHLDRSIPVVREGNLPTTVSEEVRKMILEQDKQPALASIYSDFFDYLPVAFQVLKYAAQGTIEERHRASLFFVTQCRAKITQRVRAIFKGYHIETLREWTPDDDENSFPSRNVAIPDATLTHVLLRDEVPMVPGTTNQFVFRHEDATSWLNIILSMLVHAQKQVQVDNVDDPGSSAERLMKSLTLLHLLLASVPRHFWSYRTLSIAMSASRFMANAEDSDCPKDYDDDDDLDETLEWKADWSTLPSATLHFVRAMFSACACISACHYISHSALLRQPLEVSYRALDLPLEKPTFPLETAMFTQWFQAIQNEQARKRLIGGATSHCDNLMKQNAKGTCHCESGFMAALVAREEGQSNASFQDFARHVTRLAEDTHGLDIGVAKKSSGACWLLAEVIKEMENIHLKLPGTHSFFYPWLPPPYLPERILARLKDRLLDRLISMVNEEETSYQSRTSSPTSIVGAMGGFDSLDSSLEETHKASKTRRQS